jgi:uncharacterized protein with FMN-binding domain
MALYGTFGLKRALNLTIHPVDLSQISDGTYTGSYNSYRWSTTVEVTVSNHKITEIKKIKVQQGRDSLVNDLIDEIITKQTTNLDAVSGATASRKCFLKAVENALSNDNN